MHICHSITLYIYNVLPIVFNNGHLWNKGQFNLL